MFTKYNPIILVIQSKYRKQSDSQIIFQCYIENKELTRKVALYNAQYAQEHYGI